MGSPDPIANAIKELTKEIKKQNKILENLTEVIKNSNNYISIPQTYDPYMRDPITNPPYTFTCKDTSTTGNPPYIFTCKDTSTTGNPPYYGTGVVGADWTNKDSLEALK